MFPLIEYYRTRAHTHTPSEVTSAGADRQKAFSGVVTDGDQQVETKPLTSLFTANSIQTALRHTSVVNLSPRQRAPVRVLSANHSEDSLCKLPAAHSLDGGGVRLTETHE